MAGRETAASARFGLALFAVVALVTLALGIAPRYPQDWLLETALVLIAVPLLMSGCHRLRYPAVRTWRCSRFCCCTRSAPTTPIPKCPMTALLGRSTRLRTPDAWTRLQSLLARWAETMIAAPPSERRCS